MNSFQLEKGNKKSIGYKEGAGVGGFASLGGVRGAVLKIVCFSIIFVRRLIFTECFL